MKTKKTTTPARKKAPVMHAVKKTTHKKAHVIMPNLAKEWSKKGAVMFLRPAS